MRKKKEVLEAIKTRQEWYAELRDLIELEYEIPMVTGEKITDLEALKKYLQDKEVSIPEKEFIAQVIDKKVVPIITRKSYIDELHMLAKEMGLNKKEKIN
jgi:hypothetical protein